MKSIISFKIVTFRIKEFFMVCVVAHACPSVCINRNELNRRNNIFDSESTNFVFIY